MFDYTSKKRYKDPQLLGEPNETRTYIFKRQDPIVYNLLKEVSLTLIKPRII